MTELSCYIYPYVDINRKGERKNERERERYYLRQ